MEIKAMLVAMQQTALSLMDCWLVKLVISIAVAVSGNVQGMALCAFTVLVFIDLLAKWIAIAHEYLKEQGKNADLWESFLAIKTVHCDNKINSSVMEQRFMGKILWYLIITIIAISADYLTAAVGYKSLLLPVAWLYLSLTEVMSILEKFRAAEVVQADALLELIKKINPLNKWR